MNKILQFAKRKIFPMLPLHFRAYYSLIRNKGSYLHTTGWIKSFDKKKPIDLDGSPIPWMNYPVIELLKERLNKDQNIFEFGSGYSTFFYSQKVKAVTSVEYDKDWYELIKSGMPKNVNIIYKKKDIDGDYCRSIKASNEKFEVVIVDGRDRVNCVKQAIPTLSLNGIILLDDSQREAYKEGIDHAKNLGFRALNIEGLKATGSGVDRSTILYRSDNCLGI